MSAIEPGQPVIAHVIGATIAGGAETFVANLTIALAAAGHNVVLLALSNRSDHVGTSLRQRLRDANVRFFCGPTEKIGFGSIVWYRRMMGEIGPTIVHLHTPNTELAHWLGTLGLSKPKLFRTLHNTTMALGRLTRFALTRNQVEISVACGAEVAQVAHQFVDGPVQCIPNGIAFHWPIQDQTEKRQARQRLGLAENAWHFLNIGRISANTPRQLQKAQDILMAAWRQARFQRNDVFLHLLGDGNLRSALETENAQDAHIIFHGVRADVHDWLLAADCFVMPSRYEGLPIAGIEALGTGLPCIFSDIPPLRELTDRHALWAPPEDVAALSAALETAVHGELSTPDASALRHRYGINNAAAGYGELYEKTQAGFSSDRSRLVGHNNISIQ